MNKTTVLAAAIVMALGAGAVRAEVSAAEAEKLKGELTPLGAIRAGNKDGSIPAWDGGYTTVAPGWKPGDPRPDPFASEKPLYSIDAKNMDKYADKLTDGVKALMQKYPDYRIDVYPTHRTHAAPQWVYDNTFKNATRAKLVSDGEGVEGAYGGTPFPIPKNAYEVMWNHRLAWEGGPGIRYPLTAWVVTEDGNRALASKGVQTLNDLYYDPSGSLETFKNEWKEGTFIADGPPYKVGEAIMAHDPMNYATQPRILYQYLVGQRRVRKAPSIAYDTPDFVVSGIGYADEAFSLFGPINRHDLKLIGLEEKFIPYNSNKSALATVDELVRPKFLNPDKVRWELHRVWVVEATLKPGKRHVVSKRRYYLDEDNHEIALFDGWDAQGQLWRTSYSLGLLCPDGPGYAYNLMWGGYNLQTSTYFLNSALNEQRVQYKLESTLFPDANFTPEAIGRGVR